MYSESRRRPPDRVAEVVDVGVGVVPFDVEHDGGGDEHDEGGGADGEQRGPEDDPLPVAFDRDGCGGTGPQQPQDAQGPQRAQLDGNDPMGLLLDETLSLRARLGPMCAGVEPPF